MIDKRHLIGKSVIIKLDSVSKALTGVVSHVENDGIWFISGDIIGEIASAMAGLPLGVNEPAVYVPFSKISWLMAPNE
jgi:hypothetical protein